MVPASLWKPLPGTAGNAADEPPVSSSTSLSHSSSHSSFGNSSDNSSGSTSGDTSGNAVLCQLCSHFCTILPGSSGLCGVRVNKGGALFSLVGSHIAAANLDPVEKKPLYHFLSGTQTFSIGTYGCNLSCDFCQNHSLSMVHTASPRSFGQKVTPEQIVAEALACGASSIAYTYNEPTVFFELMQQTAACAISHGLKNIIVSNGFQSPACLNKLKGLIHAANIDLKGYTEDFYQRLCGARLGPVLDNLKRIKDMGWWLEVTTLLIPEENDSTEELQNLAGFIATELGQEVPWHISRFHPAHSMQHARPTPVKTLEQAWDIGKAAGLDYVYLGNVTNHPAAHTICPACGQPAIIRNGFAVAAPAAACPACGYELAGIWK